MGTFRRRRHAPVRPDNVRANGDCSGGCAGISQLRLNRQRGGGRRQDVLHVAGDVDAPGDDMDGIGDVEPDMAINAAAFVPPALAAPRIDMNRDDVRAAVVDGIGDVHMERIVPVVLEIQLLAVDIHRRVAEHAFKVKPEAFAPVRRRYVNALPVPGGGDRQSSMSHVALRIKRALHHIVVRQVYGPPGGVAKGRGR